MSTLGKTLHANTDAFVTHAGRKETPEERKRYANGAGCYIPPEFQNLPKGSPQRAAMFAQWLGTRAK